MSNTFYNITHQDIDKVPFVKIFNTELDEVIQSACKYVLTESMNRKDGYKNDEVAIIIDINTGKIVFKAFGKDGKILIDNDNYENIIVFSEDLSLIVIHNHPNNSELSYNDILEFLNADSIISIIAVGNRGRLSILTKITNEFSYYSRLYRSMARKIYTDSLDNITKQVLNNCDIHKLSYRNLGGIENG